MAGQVTSAVYEITDGHGVLPPGNTTTGSKRSRGRPARRWRDELDDYWKGTIWQRIARDRQTGKQHMLRPSPNHGTLRLHNDGDDDNEKHAEQVVYSKTKVRSSRVARGGKGTMPPIPED